MVFAIFGSKNPGTSYLKHAFSAPVVQKYAYHKRGCRRGGRHRWRPRRDSGRGGPSYEPSKALRAPALFDGGVLAGALGRINPYVYT